MYTRSCITFVRFANLKYGSLMSNHFPIEVIAIENVNKNPCDYLFNGAKNIVSKILRSTPEMSSGN